MKNLIATAMTVSALAGTALAVPTIEFLPEGYTLTSLGNGGTVGAGNVTGDLSYETFRWTQSGGVVRLGLATVPALGVGAGTPDISYDGTSISASILSSDMLMTQGVWHDGTGWTETMPPMPPTGAILDNGYGSAWGLSGDGQTLTGFHWNPAFRALACTWSSSTGVVDLPQNDGRSARVNGANYDGSVVVGWEERPDGAWRPTAWRNGTKITLEDTEAFCQATAVNSDGSVIVGSSYDDPAFMRVAARYTWNGASYDMSLLGVLPGTAPNFGEAMLMGVSGDGSLAVGWNRYQQGPSSPIDGIVWTPTGGMVNATTFIAGLGLAGAFTPDMDIRGLTAVSPDGSAITGHVLHLSTSKTQSFIIRITPPPCIGDADGNGIVNFADITATLTNYGNSGAPFAAGDADGNAVVNFADITAVLANFGSSC